MIHLYVRVDDNVYYTESQLLDIYCFLKYKKNIGTFEDWIQSEIDEGYIIDYTNRTEQLSAEEILEYAVRHNKKYSEITFRHENGKEFVLLDTDLELFRDVSQSKYMTLRDMEMDYENEPLFTIIKES